MPRPPGLVPPVDDVVEGEAHGAPHEVVDGARRRHHPRGAQQHGHVDEAEPRRPGAVRERARHRPERHRRQRAGEEEVVHLGVEAEAAEHAQRPHDAPDDGRVEEDVVAGARPGAPLRQLRRVADAGHRLQQPPRRGEVDRRRQHGADELHGEHGARRDLHVVAQLEVLQEHDGLRHADVAVRLERHVGERPPRVEVADDELRHDVEPGLLVGGGRDDADGEREEEGDAGGEEDAPVRELELAAEALAGEEREAEHDYQHHLEPPLRHGGVVPPHQPGVHVAAGGTHRRLGLLPYRPAVVERDVGQRGRQRREAEAVGEGEEDAEVDLAGAVVAGLAELERGRVQHLVHVVPAAVGHEHVGGDDGEPPGAVRVAPVGEGNDHVDDEEEAGHDVDDGERRRRQRRSEEPGHGGPVQAERADAEAVDAGPDLLRRHRLLPDEAHHRDGGDGREQVVGHNVVGEAGGEHGEEELQPRGASPRPLLLLVQRPEEGDLHQVRRPPHVGGVDEELPEEAGPAVPHQLRGLGEQHGGQRVDVPVVEGLDDGDDADGVDGVGAGVGEDGDEDVLLEVEGTRVEGEGAPHDVDGLGGEARRHELAERQHHDLHGEGGDVQRVLTVPEELVGEGQQRAGEEPQEPGPERQRRQCRVVGDGHRQPDLLDRAVVYLLYFL